MSVPTGLSRRERLGQARQGSSLECPCISLVSMPPNITDPKQGGDQHINHPQCPYFPARGGGVGRIYPRRCRWRAHVKRKDPAIYMTPIEHVIEGEGIGIAPFISKRRETHDADRQSKAQLQLQNICAPMLAATGICQLCELLY